MNKCLVLAMLLSSSSFAADYGNLRVKSSRIDSVYDGDTFKITIPSWHPVVGKRIEVRISGIDTPEIKGKCQSEIDQAKKARDYLSSRLKGAKTFDLRKLKRDKYFRLNAQVWVSGVNLGDELIKAGLAREYKSGRRGSWCQ